MGLWIEIHCDCPPDKKPDRKTVFPEGVAAGSAYHPERICYSDQNNNPAGMAAGAATSMRLIGELTRQAKDGGWVFSKNKGWRCPSCKQWSKE